MSLSFNKKGKLHSSGLYLLKFFCIEYAQSKNPLKECRHSIKAGLSPSKKICFICFNDNPSKIVKNAFYFTLKAFFVKIFQFFSCLFWACRKNGLVRNLRLTFSTCRSECVQYPSAPFGKHFYSVYRNCDISRTKNARNKNDPIFNSLNLTL